jgi:hypothetical protein
MPGPTQLSDVVWGGRIRPKFQYGVSSIARNAAHSVERSVRGNMVQSSETVTYRFLDGGVSETRGIFGPQSGMRWFGTLAKAHLLYELDGDPAVLLRRPDLPTRAELRVRVRSEAEAARRKSGT